MIIISKKIKIKIGLSVQCNIYIIFDKRMSVKSKNI